MPYFNTFFLKGTLVKYKFILVSPWLLQSLVNPKTARTKHPEHIQADGARHQRAEDGSVLSLLGFGVYKVWGLGFRGLARV